MRRFTKLKYVYCYVNTQRLTRYLIDFGFRADRIIYKEHEWERFKVEKVKHYIFNVLFYLPLKGGKKHNPKYGRWIYGEEYLNKLREFTDVNWIIADGTLDMLEVYPNVDCYIKINKCPHNDRNKINKECAYNNIPEKAFDVWREDFTLNEIVNWINEIRGLS
jgi:hypothetical protein